MYVFAHWVSLNKPPLSVRYWQEIEGTLELEDCGKFNERTIYKSVGRIKGQCSTLGLRILGNHPALGPEGAWGIHTLPPSPLAFWSPIGTSCWLNQRIRQRTKQLVETVGWQRRGWGRVESVDPVNKQKVAGNYTLYLGYIISYSVTGPTRGKGKQNGGPSSQVLGYSARFPGFRINLMSSDVPEQTSNLFWSLHPHPNHPPNPACLTLMPND